MVGARARKWYEERARERQKEGQERGRKVQKGMVENLPPSVPDPGKARDQAGKAVRCEPPVSRHCRIIVGRRKARQQAVTREQPVAAKRGGPGFPAGAKELFDKLWQNVVHLSAQWQLFLDLYSTKEDVAVLNATAPAAFRFIQDALISSMVMAFARLTDPVSALKKKQNLSLERLIQAVAPGCDGEFRQSLEGRLQAIRGHIAPLKEMRNRKVGHTDFDTAFAATPDATMAFTRQEIGEGLGMIADLMNSVSLRFTRSTTVFQEPALHGTGGHLIFYLKAALDHFEAKKQADLRRVRIPTGGEAPSN
jgi:hypothetical protein